MWSCSTLSARSSCATIKAHVYVAAVVYTKSGVCAAFLRQAERRGFVWVDDKGASQDGWEVDEVVESALRVHGIGWDQLGSAGSSHRHVAGGWRDGPVSSCERKMDITDEIFLFLF
jgi:hypothetical protein